MNTTESVGELQIEQDHAFQKRDWHVQRVAQLLFLAILIAALAGFFGSGPISDASAMDARNIIALDYQRFSRRQSQQTLQIHIHPESFPKNQSNLRIWLDAAYVDQLELEHITPEPESAEIGGGRVTYVFPMAVHNDNACITMYIRAQHAGNLSGKLGIENGPELHFHQFIYP